MTAQEAKITAEQAKRDAETVLNEISAKKLEEIDTLIRSAAKHGRFSIHLTQIVSSFVKKNLEERGFVVKNGSEPLAGDSWTTILW